MGQGRDEILLMFWIPEGPLNRVQTTEIEIHKELNNSSAKSPQTRSHKQEKQSPKTK